MDRKLEDCQDYKIGKFTATRKSKNIRIGRIDD
jgi:hypothetical protein